MVIVGSLADTGTVYILNVCALVCVFLLGGMVRIRQLRTVIFLFPYNKSNRCTYFVKKFCMFRAVPLPKTCRIS
jgi:hypothetical protein